MATFSDNFDGSGGAYTMTLTVDATGGWHLDAKKNSGDGYWTASPQRWSVTINGKTWSGTWTYDFRSSSSKRISSGSYSRPAVTTTYRADASANMDSGRGTAKAGGTFSATGTASTPPAPTMSAPSQITANSMLIQFRSNGTGGSAITSWDLQYSTSSSFSGATTIKSNGTTTVTDLKPGTTYYFRARGNNAVGAGAWSSSVNARTLSGMYVSDGSTWKASEVYMSDGSTWKQCEVYVSDGSSWKAAG